MSQEEQDRGDEAEKAQRVRALADDAKLARDEFIGASQDFNALSIHEAEVLADLMQAALRMNEAKVKIDRALKAIRALAEMV